MGIDNLQEKVNGFRVTDLAVLPSEKETEDFFDLETEFTLEDREAVRNFLLEQPAAFDLTDFASVAWRFVTLFPEESTNVVTDKKHVFSRLSQYIGFHDDSGDLYNRLEYLMTIFSLFPDKKGEVYGISNTVITAGRKIEGYHNNNLRWLVFSLVRSMKMVFPGDDFSKDIDEKDIDEGLEAFNTYKKDAFYAEGAALASDMVLVIPSLKERFHLDSDFWKNSKQVLDGFRMACNWEKFVSLSLALTVLSAESAQISPEGRINIIPKAHAFSGLDVPDVPERRGF